MESIYQINSTILKMKRYKANFFLWAIMCNLTEKNPLPWRSELGLNSKVCDANDQLIMEFPSLDDADNFIKFAEEFKKDKEEERALQKFTDSLEVGAGTGA